MALKILLHHIDLFCKSRCFFGTFKLWFDQCRQTWGFSQNLGFSMPFSFFLLKISSFYDLTG